MEPNLQRVLYGSTLKQLIATMELVCRAVGQTRVQPDVFLVVREAPVGNSQLELFRNRRIYVLYQFKRDVRGDAASGQFREGGDILLISSPIAIVSKHDGRPRGFLPTAPVVANAFRLGTPAAQRILLEAIRVLEAEPIALFVVGVGVVGICISVCILLLRSIVAIVVVVAVAIVCSIVVAVAVVGSAAARTIPLLDGPSSSPIRLRPILIAGPSSTPATSSAPSSTSRFLLLVAIVPLVVVLMVLLLLLRLLPLWWPLRATPSSVRSVCQLRLS